MDLLQTLRLLLKGPTPREMAAQLRKPHGILARKVGQRMNLANAPLYAGVWPALELQPGQHVLEIGFGNGHFFQDLAQQSSGSHLFGLDFSEEMVQQAKAYNKALITSGALSLVRGNSDGMPFDSASFDRIFCINVVYFWDDPAPHLQEVRRVLRPGGTFTAVLRTRTAMKQLPFAAYGFAMYEQADWEAVLRANGFAPTATRVIHEPEIRYEGRSYIPESLVVTANPVR